jgi:hypothetical protein
LKFTIKPISNDKKKRILLILSLRALKQLYYLKKIKMKKYSRVGIKLFYFRVKLMILI